MRARGMTLIEIMVTVAISSIMVTAAVAACTTMLVMTKSDTRKAASETQLALGLSLLDRNLGNTGVAFPNPRFSFRVHDNVAAAIPNYDGSSTPVVAYGGATAGVILGTDVIEVAMADSGLRRGGAVASWSACGTASCTMTLQTADPFLNAELGTGANGMLVLVQDDLNPDQQWCLGRITAVGSTAAPTVTFDRLNDDLTTGAGGCANAVLTTTTPSVYVVERRLRFMIYQKAGGADLGLYFAQGSANGYFPDPSLTPPSLLATSVENLQVRLAIGPRFDGTANTVSGCTTSPGKICVANDPLALPDPLIDPAIQTFTSSGSWPAGIAYTKSALVELTARAAPSPGEGAPASMNRAAGPIDGFRRVRAAATAVLMLNGGLPTQ